MHLGGNFIAGSILAPVDKFRELRSYARSCWRPCPTRDRFGVADFDDTGPGSRAEEKAERPKSDRALVGVYLFIPAIC